MYLSEIKQMLKNSYAKEWRRKNKDKVKKINERYWDKKARQYQEQLKGGCSNETTIKSFQKYI